MINNESDKEEGVQIKLHVVLLDISLHKGFFSLRLKQFNDNDSVMSESRLFQNVGPVCTIVLRANAVLTGEK